MRWTLAQNETILDGGAGGDGGTGEGADERPAWLPENFSKPEDLAKSYDESRREMDRLRSQLDQERTQFSEALERIEAMQPPAAPPAAGNQNDLLAAYAQAVENQDAAAQLAITLQLNQQQVEGALEKRFKDLEPKLGSESKALREQSFRMAEERISKEFGDRWDKVAPGVDKLLKERQHWLPQETSVDGFASAIREAAQVVEAERIVADQQAAERDRNAKLSAQTAESAGVARHSTVTDEKKAAWDEVKNAKVGGFSDIARGG